MRLMILCLILSTLSFITMSEKVGEKSLKCTIKNSNLIFVGDVSEINNYTLLFSNVIEIISENDRIRNNYKMQIKDIHHSYKLPGNNGKYLVLSHRDKFSLNHKSIQAVFRIVDEKILITNPFLKDLKNCGLSTSEMIYEDFRFINSKNKISDGVGVLIELNDFVEVINFIHNDLKIGFIEYEDIQGSILCD